MSLNGNLRKLRLVVIIWENKKIHVRKYFKGTSLDLKFTVLIQPVDQDTVILEYGKTATRKYSTNLNF